jgi:glycosyltransferase involved in cell wall biosynthesis
MNCPNVSIITRTKDREQFLSRAVQSVLGQVDAPNWEWIVVNDAGDKTAVEAIIARVPQELANRVKVIHLPESKGMEHASNQGIQQARGEYLVIHDDDDSWHPDFLRQMTAWLDREENEAFAGVVCHSKRIEETVEADGIRIHSETPFNTWLASIDPWTILEENPYPPISFMFRRSAYEEVGPFDESLPVLGDWEFNVRLILRWPLGILPEMLAHYHHRPRSATGASANSITAGHDTHRHWEKVLRERWRQSPPLPGLESFGALASVAGSIKADRDRLDRLFSLPIRPGP